MPYAVACNRAVANGSAELVVMMNNDVDVRPDFIERVVAPFAADPGLGSVGTLLLRPGEERIDSAGMVIDTTLSGFTRLRGRPSAEAGAARPGVTRALRRRRRVPARRLGTGRRSRRDDSGVLRGSGSGAAPAPGRVAGGPGARRGGRAHRWGDIRASLGRSAPARRLWPRLCAAPIRRAAYVSRAASARHRGDRGRRRPGPLPRPCGPAGTGGGLAWGGQPARANATTGGRAGPGARIR